MKVEDLTPVPLAVPVCWAVLTLDRHGWRTNGLDRFLRWYPDFGGWCFPGAPRFGLGIPSETTWEARTDIVVYHGRAVAFEPTGMALVIASGGSLHVLPVDALRVETDP
jgi:hypothetical protein